MKTTTITKILACLGIFGWATLSAVAAPLPTIDLSQDTARQVVVAQGTEQIYQGHPTTLLLPDGRTMYAVWTLGHGGTCGPMKRSDDGGKTWSELLPTPEDWTKARNCPSLYRLTDPSGISRLFVFAGQGPDGNMCEARSEDEGRTWTSMVGNGLKCIMPFCTIAPVEGGKRLVGLTNIRRPGETQDKTSNIIAQSESTDGGLTWSAWRIVLDMGDIKPCEPELVRSPDGRQLLCLLRENSRKIGGLFMTSDDEGRTWSEARPLPPALHGDRHQARYTPDGRLVVCFRDTGKENPTRNHFVAWVGRYEDILAGRDGQYRIKLLHSYAGSDCGYPGLEVLPDGTIVATTYVKYRPGAEKQSVVSTRFTLAEIDRAATTASAKPRDVGGNGIYTLDDDAAVYVGDWSVSTKQTALVGKSYRHDDNREQGAKSARFATTIVDEGNYEVRLLYVATSNRATNVPVTVHAADGDHPITINQREECLVKGVARALGVFKFAAGTEAVVTVSNKDANGFVVVDGLQIVPVDVAEAQRAGESAATAVAKAPEAAAPRKNAAAVAVSPLAEKTAPAQPPKEDTEPVQLAKEASAAAVNGQHYDLIVVGGTASGVACAVRAAREGCAVLLVQHNRHIGGMLTNGLMQWDALYGGPRAPLFTELLGRIEKHYIETFGKDSKEHQIIRCTHEHYPVSWVEPHVMERECNRLVAGEKNITLLLTHYPSAVEREGVMLKAVTLREYGTTHDIRVTADMFSDATYEGDLLALARVPYRVGREARAEYDEPHAGKIFCNVGGGSAPRDAIEGRLNIRPYNQSQGSVDPESPFSADGAVQAYNYRFCVSRDPANRVLPEKPANYNRDDFLHFDRKGIATNGGPNQKSHMNSPILPGENHAYPEATWPEREKIIARHRDFALGLMWFLQNDESVSAKQREGFREWGLAKDEFPDNGHIPYEMYVREARRLVGRYVFKEQDNSLAPGFARTPILPDSIAITDWYMDSHSCTKESRPGFHYDGKLILTEQSRPAQIPYRAMLPQGVDNLLVPVCLSSTHVGWGALRLEPVWMSTGEAAGFAAGMAKREQTTPGALDADQLVRTLVEHRQLVSFFNDVKVDGSDAGIPAAEYFATKGFFASYDAQLDRALTQEVAAAWVRGLAALQSGKLDPIALARQLSKAELKDAPPCSASSLEGMLGEAKVPGPIVARIVKELRPSNDLPLTRGAVCRAFYVALTP